MNDDMKELVYWLKKRMEPHAPETTENRIIELYLQTTLRQGKTANRFIKLTNSKEVPSPKFNQEFEQVRSEGWELKGRAYALEQVLKIIALRYANNIGYKKEWRP